MEAIAYHRVSTAQQGRSGLGIEAQQAAVSSFIASQGYDLIASFTEVESGKHDQRPELEKAIHRAEVTGAKLVIAKLDRLSRNASFLYELKAAGVDFIAADMPEVNTLTLGVMIAVAQHEREVISERTKSALRVAKKRLEAQGKRLGNPNGAEALRRAGKGNTAAVKTIQDNADFYAQRLKSVVEDIQAEGNTSYKAIADELNRQHIKTRRGGRWWPTTVKNLIERTQSDR